MKAGSYGEIRSPQPGVGEGAGHLVVGRIGFDVGRTLDGEEETLQAGVLYYCGRDGRFWRGEDDLGKVVPEKMFGERGAEDE